MSKFAGTRFIAFVIVMSALTNVLGLLIIPVGPFTFHLVQLPIVFSGLGAGAVSGGIVGLLGTFVMAFALAKPNPYLIGGNAILGFLTGALYRKMRKMSGRSILPQMLSVFFAYLLQMPYVYVTDVYLMGMPNPIVVAILGLLLVEDLTSVLLSHMILYRIDVTALLSGSK